MRTIAAFICTTCSFFSLLMAYQYRLSMGVFFAICLFTIAPTAYGYFSLFHIEEDDKQ